MNILYFLIVSAAFVFFIGIISLIFDVIEYFNPDFIDDVLTKFLK